MPETSSNARLTQQSLEVVQEPTAVAKATQVVLDAVQLPEVQRIRLTQLVIETIEARPTGIISNFAF
jgi:hypothetical protein